MPGVVDENARKSNTIVTFAGGRQLFRFDSRRTSVILEKKLGAAAIGKQRACNHRCSS